MSAHAVHTLSPALRKRQRLVREKLAAARRKYPDGIPDSVRKAIFADPETVELARAVLALRQRAGQTVDLVAGTNPEPFSTSRTSNWVARAGGLPTLIQHVAHDLMEKGNKTESEAIKLAVGIVRNWSHGHDGHGHSVSAATVAEATKAIAEWDAKRARARASTSLSNHVRRVIELARYAIFGPKIDLASMPGDRFPITDATSLEKAIRAVGRARPNTDAERAAVRRHIIAQAKRLGLQGRIPDSWNADGSLA